MNLVDSSGWLSYFEGDTNAATFAEPITRSEALVVPTVCMYEVFKRMLAKFGEESALQAVGIMSLGEIADLTREIAIKAAKISTDLRIAMADSIILATARAYEATLWTQDADFDGIAGVEFVKR